MWKPLPEKEYFFSKNINDHSVSAYKELYEGIDKIFKVIATLTTSTEDRQERLFYPGPEVSFSAKIDDLKEQNANLSKKLGY
jgi:hypothetical protein